jgi:hypothetical protein
LHTFKLFDTLGKINAMDKKFLEGFVEITAAAGLSPREAHDLLTKQATPVTSFRQLAGMGAKLLGKKIAGGASSAGGGLKSLAKNKAFWGLTGLGAAGYGTYKGVQALNNKLNDVNRYISDYTNTYDPSQGAPPSGSVAGSPTYTQWGEPGNTPRIADPFNPSTPQATAASAAIPKDVQQYAADQRAMRSAVANRRKIDRTIAEAQGKYDAANRQITNPGGIDAVADLVDEVPIIGPIAQSWQQRPVKTIEEQTKKLSEQRAAREKELERIAELERRIKENKQ